MQRRCVALLSALLVGLALGLMWARPTPYVHSADATANATGPPTVVINEVAWGGTAASVADEWIELLNTTELTVSLTGWRIRAVDGDPDLLLSGDIAPGATYLVERTDDDTVSDIDADLVCSFGTGLSNAGETLVLSDAGGAVQDTVNNDGGPWPNGSDGAAPSFRSMERLSPYAQDQDANWVSNDGLVVNGLDAAGNPLAATPGALNAAYLPAYLQNADLALVKLGPQLATPGSLVSHTIVLRNRGGVTATNVTLTDTLPRELTFVTQQSPFPYTRTAGAVVWSIGQLCPGQELSVELDTRLGDDVQPGTPLTNTASATTPVTQLATHNDSAAWQLLTEALTTDLAVATSGQAVVTDSGTIDYTILVTNAGAYAATHITVTDALPSALEVLAVAEGFLAMRAPAQVIWRLPSLAPGETQVLTLTARLTVPLEAVDQVSNHVSVWAETPDANPVNNQAIWTTSVGEARVLISCAMYDGYQLNDEDEAIELVNVGTATAALGQWKLCKDQSGALSCYPLTDASLPPGSRLWLAMNAHAFETSFGFPPQVDLPTWPRLANTGDEIILQSDDGRFVDALVYGDGNTAVPGWHGSALLYYYNYLRAETGQLLCRIVDEATHLPITDTDTAADWIQYRDNIELGRRVRYPGWDFDALFSPVSVTEPVSLVVGVAPDNAFDVVAGVLLKAQRSISLEVYSLLHPRLVDILAQKAREGVQTSILLEGGPVGVSTTSQDWQAQLHACQILEAAGAQCWFMIHMPESRIYNRYEYLHAKMAIIDDLWVLVGSQNLTLSGLPADDKTNGTTGSRGAVVAIASPVLAERARQLYSLDLDPGHHNDLLRWNTGLADRYGQPIEGFAPPSETDGISYTVRFPDPLYVNGTLGLELMTAPESALRQSDALLGLLALAGAGDRVLVEQLYEHVAWGVDPSEDPNLRLQAYVAAARRGAQVRILLNGRNFAHGALGPPEESLATVRHLTSTARDEGLDLRAAVGNPTGEGIHNKMVLVALSNGRGYAHIGSINGSEASNKINREVAVQIASPEVYAYLERVFSVDWWLANPMYLPMVVRHYVPPPPPADHLLISEVSYTGSAAGEWIEIHNPLPQPVMLDTCKLGDAEVADAFEGMFQFPPGTVLEAGGTLVIAVNSAQVPQADLEFYESTPDVPNMLPYPAWGSTQYPLALRDSGDHVVLLNDQDRVVDVVVWGDRGYPGVVPHPGVTTVGASLERFPADRDTDDCATDLRERYPPTPGTVPGVAW